MNINHIEDRLYETLRPDAPQIKVAMLLAKTFKDLDFPADEIINTALDRLAARKDIETYGDIYRWRRSEIKRFSAAKA